MAVISTNTAKLNPLVLKLLLSFLAQPGWSRDTNEPVDPAQLWIQLHILGTVPKSSSTAFLPHDLRSLVTGYIKFCTFDSTLAKVLVEGKLQNPLFSMFAQRTTMSFFILQVYFTALNKAARFGAAEMESVLNNHKTRLLRFNNLTEYQYLCTPTEIKWEHNHPSVSLQG